MNGFFDKLGIEVLQGYGLTETCVSTHCNRPGENELGTVGPALCADIEVKTLSDGEICIRGPNVAKGYYNRPIATEQAWDSDGWFKTGDLGEIRADGCLSITGRKKELLVTAGGKKIQPERIEFLLLEHRAVLQSYVYGDGKPYLVALIVPNKDFLRSLLPQQDGRNWAEICNDPAIIDIYQKIQVTVNEPLGSFETVKAFALVPEEFSIDNGLLTPTLKLKRPAIAKHHAELLAGLYHNKQKSEG